MTERKTRALTPYQRIVRNAKRGRGVQLTPDEVATLAGDDAISQAALVDDGLDAEGHDGR